MGTDPFDLARLRAATLSAWASSSTRLREDLATERDLTTVGYRDRVCTELIANAADAASDAALDGTPADGVVAVWVDDAGALHVANTGSPLTAAGVASLTALRVSAKSDPGQVGRFGVGFTATAAVADRIEIRSVTGSIVFDKALTADALVDAGIDLAGGDSAGGDAVPVLRLAWATDELPADGYVTEVVLHLRDDVSADRLLADLAGEMSDLMVELVALQRVTVADVEFSATRVSAPDGLVRTTITRTADGATTESVWLEAAHAGTRWVVEMSASGPVLRERDVLRAPTPTDIELTLPARCITDLPLTADRRRLHPDAAIDEAAQGYPDLVVGLESRWRPLLVPGAALTVGPEDARLTEAVLEALRERAWVPAAADGGGEDGSVDEDAGAAVLVPTRAVLIADLTDELAQVLSPVMGDLVHQDVSGPGDRARLRRVGVVEIGWAQLAERLTGLDRDPQWWHELYAALSPLITSRNDADELGALPIPRSDGRMNVGARGLFVVDAADVAPGWIPTVHADAFHPLLERLGVERISVEQILADPALRALVESSSDADDDELRGLADEVIAILAAEPDVAVPDWLGTLLLPDADDDFSPADELLLPGSPMAEVLIDDSPFGRVDAEFAAQAGVDVLRRIGAVWGFSVVTDELPVGPDHDLADEEQWWDSLSQPPEVLVAVRDLDLVDEGRWVEALSLLAADETIAPLLLDRDGYTAWWLRHHATIGGRRLGRYRPPSDLTFAGLIDPLDHPVADDLAGALAGPDVEGAADATMMLDHLGDSDREVAPGVAVRAYAALVDAARGERIDPADLPVPHGIRAVDGEVHDHDDVVVVDQPWYVQVLAAARMVLAGRVVEPATAAGLADLLDLPLASETVTSSVLGEGDAFTADSMDAVLFAASSGRDVGAPIVRVHDELCVEVRWETGETEEHAVSWWVDDRGITHLSR